ncbi:MAG: hypothetical protein AAF609_12515 [Cyanobacteria bacterium P01_C01_bin.120]
MVAYNFQPQFAEAISTWQKRQTIRALGKRRHARIGDALQLYTGQRTKECRKLLALDPPCTAVLPISIGLNGRMVEVFIDDVYVAQDQLEQLAKDDGFNSVDEFIYFFESRLPFEGVIVKW